MYLIKVICDEGYLLKTKLIFSKFVKRIRKYRIELIVLNRKLFE